MQIISNLNTWKLLFQEKNNEKQSFSDVRKIISIQSFSDVGKIVSMPLFEEACIIWKNSIITSYFSCVFFAQNLNLNEA